MRLIEFGEELAVVDHHQHVAGLDELVVADPHLAHIALDLGAHRGNISLDEGVVRALDETRDLPPVPGTANAAEQKNGGDAVAKHAAHDEPLPTHVSAVVPKAA